MAIFNKRKFVPPENANSHTLTDITLAVCVCAIKFDLLRRK
jgi:hypothetical protein